MRLKYCLVFLGVLCFSNLVEAKKARTAPKPQEACIHKLLDAASLVRFWNGETLDHSFTKIADLNGAIVWEVAEFSAKHKRLPLSEELGRKLKTYREADNEEEGAEEKDLPNLLEEVIRDFDAYYELDGAIPADQLLPTAVAELPGRFEGVRQAARKQLIAYFKKHLRLPNLEQLAEKLRVDPFYLASTMGDPKDLWEAARKGHCVEFLDAQKKIVTAFMRAIAHRDSPDHLKVRSNTPDLQEVFMALVRSESNKYLRADHLDGKFTQADFEALLNEVQTSPDGPQPLFPSPVLFPGGIAQLEQEARAHNPGAFKNHISEITYSLERAEAARDAIIKKKGFLIASVTAGMPIDEDQYQLMLRYAEDLDYDVLLLPANQILDGLDERLLQNPRVHVVTNTIENPFLKIWHIPIMPKNQSSMASLSKRGQFKPGQTVIVGHPQLTHKIVPTGSNHLRETSLWSPGSISKNIYPFRHAVQGRLAELAKNYHQSSFLVVQKADRDTGVSAEGVQNFWHVRPVEYVDDRKKGGEACFIDLGHKYRVVSEAGAPSQIEVTTEDPVALSAGDLHDWVADQRMLRSYRDVLFRFAGCRDIVLHDPDDGYTHNHHESLNETLLIKKFREGNLDYHGHLMGLAQTTNTFLGMRSNLRVWLADSNHSVWGRKLVNFAPRLESQSIINGEFLAELEHASRVLGYADPLEWVFHGGRNQYIAGLPPAVRLKFEQKTVLVSDPTRVQVLGAGVPKDVGPKHRIVHLNFHGHQGANGGRGSEQSHANANGDERSIVGDSHHSAILGGMVNIATSTPKVVEYNKGGYSSWNQSFALVYSNGTIQLITYSSLTGTYQQREGHDVLSSEEFFGEDPLQVIPTDNQLLPGKEVYDVYTRWLDVMGGKVR